MKSKYTPLFFIFIIMIFSMYNNYLAKDINSIYDNNWIKQLIFYIIGFLIIYLINKFNTKKIFKFHYIIYSISIIFLILVLLLGNEVNGAKAWFDLYFFSFQPSEFAKLSLAISLTKITIDFNNKPYSEIIYLIKITTLTLIPSLLVFIEPDTGAIIFFFIIFLTAFFSAKLSKFWYFIFAITSFSILAITCILYFFYQDILINIIGTSIFYRVDRIINMGNNYQINNALTLIGSSLYFGSNNSLYVPEAPTDFMFAYNFGNCGLFGAITLSLAYFSFLICIYYQSNIIKNNIFSKIFFYTLLFAIVYNILMNLGCLPIMGIPLPFLSYGGSSLIFGFIFLAIHFKLI